MKLSVELNMEEVSRLVFSELLDTRQCFLDDLESNNPSVFSTTPAYDKILIMKHIEALDLLLEWYHDPSLS